MLNAGAPSAGSGGFSLIELLVVLAIMAVLARVAAPSFRALLGNGQIRTAAQALHDGLKIARTEAIRRNESVTWTRSGTAGWSVTVDSAASTPVQSRTTEEAASVSVLPAGGNVVRFNSLGQVITPASGTTITQIDVTLGTQYVAASQVKPLRIQVSGGGAIRLCDPAVAASGVGMSCN